MVNENDVAAMESVLDDVKTNVEALDVEAAIRMLEAVKQLKANAHDTIAHIEVWLTEILESPREFNGKLYEVKSAGKWRPDHDEIKRHAREVAFVEQETGEMYGTIETAQRAVDLMYELFVSPSTMPKVGGLERMGLKKADVADFERDGKRISVTDV